MLIYKPMPNAVPTVPISAYFEFIPMLTFFWSLLTGLYKLRSIFVPYQGVDRMRKNHIWGRISKYLMPYRRFCVSIGFKGVKYGKTGENHTMFYISQGCIWLLPGRKSCSQKNILGRKSCPQKISLVKFLILHFLKY